MQAEARAQSALEFISTYAWGLLILTIVVSIILYYVNLPNSVAPSSCTLSSSTVLCKDIIAGTNPQGANSVFVTFTNTGQYAVTHPIAYLAIGDVNTSEFACYPAVLLPGMSATCQINLTGTYRSSQLLSGSIYIQVGNCGLLPNYPSTHICTGAQNQTIAGSFIAHYASTSLKPTPMLFVTTSQFSNYNPSATSVQAIDPYNNVVVNTLTLATSPSTNYPVSSYIIASPNSGYVYDIYSIIKTNPGTCTIATINTTDFNIANTLNIVSSASTDFGYYDLCGYSSGAISSNGSVIYFPIEFPNQTSDLLIINVIQHKVTGMIGLGALFFQTYGMAVSPTGANLYITGFYSSDDSAPFGVVNTGLNKVVYSTTFSSSGPDSISVTPDGSLIYYGMVNEPALTAGTLDVISATNYSIVKTIQFANYPYIYTSFSPDGKYAYIVESASNGNSNLLTLYTSNYVISNTLSLPVNSITGAVTADGKYIYIPQNNNPGTITVVNTISDQLVTTIDTNTGGQPQDVTLTPMFNTV